ncbi:MAG: IPT/TIG domain-containing protein [Acidobacteriia bacterium]|nr:IPT/TIG domain-containing protein [Terriglobia bacterium]
MRIHRITIFAVVAVVVIMAAAVFVRADQPQASLSPDRILKGTTPTITITLDKSIPDQKEVKSVRIGGHVIAVQEPSAEGKVSVPLPKLEIVGRADVEVIGRDDKSVAVGQLTYVESPQPTPIPVVGNTKELVLLLIYVGLIALLPTICTIYDIRKSYKEREGVLAKLGNNPTVQEIGSLLAGMDKGPTGFTGLTRGLVALTLILVLGFAVFHLVVFAPPKPPDIAEKLLMLIAGTLTAITGFYFGSKAATEAATQAPLGAGKAGGSVAPKITDVKWADESARKLIVSGEGFGAKGDKSSVTAGGKNAPDTKWDLKQIAVTLPADVSPGSVDIIVTNNNGDASPPWPFQVSATAAPPTPSGGAQTGGSVVPKISKVGQGSGAADRELADSGEEEEEGP